MCQRSCFLRAVCLAVLVLVMALAAGRGRDLAWAGESDAWAALRQPGTAALMRHALAPGTGDPDSFTLGDCATQRNLDARGRAQARAIGDAFRAQGIAVDRVMTSQWCRARETARLLDLAPVTDLPSLNSFFTERGKKARRTRAIRRFLADLPPDTQVVLVTHQVNITALTGVFPASGEVLVIAMDGDGESSGDGGTLDVKGRIHLRP